MSAGILACKHLGMLFTRCVFTFRTAREEVWTLSRSLRIIIFYSVRTALRGRSQRVWVLSEADRLRGWEGGRGPGRGGEGDMVVSSRDGQDWSPAGSRPAWRQHLLGAPIALG